MASQRLRARESEEAELLDATAPPERQAPVSNAGAAARANRVRATRAKKSEAAALEKELPPVEDRAAEALLISFPDYLIDTESFLGKVGGLGHAGVLLIREDGFTRYYEYGRYATADGTKGRVRRKSVPNVEIGEDGKATAASLERCLARISAQSGQGGRIDAAYFQNVSFDVMESYAQKKLRESNPGNPDYDKDRDPYTLQGNNCATFAEDVITQNRHVDRPNVLFPSPNNAANEYQEEGNAEVLYDPEAREGDRLSIGEWDEADAKVEVEIEDEDEEEEEG